MGLSEQLEKDVEGIIAQPWDKRVGQVVPSTKDVALAGGAVELNATFLYADLASSSKMVKELDRRVAAKILRSFHAAVCRLIKSSDGAVVSFDGDRVLGVFLGTTKNTNAAKCGLQIRYAVQKVIRPKFEANYPAIRDATFKIGHGVGIDSGTVLAVRAGVRGDNDLIWIGRAPNLAAKLSDIRDSPYETFITASVYKSMMDSSKLGGPDKKNMWEQRSWTFLGEAMTVYRSLWTWKP
jgi:adenylate cyclase